MNIKSAKFPVKTVTRESFAIDEVILIINLSEDQRTWGTSLVPPQHSEVQVFQSTPPPTSTQYCRRNHLNKYLHVTSYLWVFATPFELSKSLNLLWLYKVSDYFLLFLCTVLVKVFFPYLKGYVFSFWLRMHYMFTYYIKRMA